MSENKIKITPRIKSNAIAAINRQGISYFKTETSLPISKESEYWQAKGRRDDLIERISVLNVGVDFE